MTGTVSVLEPLGSKGERKFGGRQMDVEVFADLTEKEQEPTQKKGPRNWKGEDRSG